MRVFVIIFAKMLARQTEAGHGAAEEFSKPRKPFPGILYFKKSYFLKPLISYKLIPKGVLITEFVDPTLAAEETFNEAFTSLRSSVERSIGLMKEKWGALHRKRNGPLLYDPSEWTVFEISLQMSLLKRPIWLGPIRTFCDTLFGLFS